MNLAMSLLIIERVNSVVIRLLLKWYSAQCTVYRIQCTQFETIHRLDCLRVFRNLF